MEFDLYHDIKVSIWRRTKVHIEADSLEEAILACTKENYDNDESDFLYETEDWLDPSQNHGYATEEVINPVTDLALYSNTQKL